MAESLASVAAEWDAHEAAMPRVDLFADTFPEQRGFCLDPATFVVGCTSRRAGKSEGVARRLLRAEADKPRAPVLFFTLTRHDAKRIIWEPLLRLNAKHGLGLEPRESGLTFRRAGVDRIYLTGCNNATEIGKMRGSGWGAIAGDEAQNFPSYLKPLVEETLTPSLMDWQGWISLTGTPGPVPVGYFYECSKSKKWSRHNWDAFANPHVKARSLLDEVIELRGITEEHPSIQREFYGRWVYDASALVIAWDAKRNGYVEAPRLTDYVIGIDLGFDDADAVAVLGWSEASPALYLVEEHVIAKQSITQLAGRLEALVEKYKPLAMVADTGGLGKKIVDEVQRRHALPIQAAEKTEKLAHIELLNDALRCGRFFAKPGSRFAQDALLTEWDRSNPEKPKISDRYHSDVIDAVLYAYRRALHWLHVPTTEKPQTGSAAYYAQLESEMEQAAEKAWHEAQDDDEQMGIEP